ncbi:ladderlectin-like [Gambusia affinis]|uniref:ladderlectin-like n=1 Tax=Gambusia affinis TaxID=33528 RepID=UPI001CDC402B|nr:ladderlectin-like [Gambusia affinis]
MAAGLVFTLLLGLSFGLWDGADAGCHLRAPTEHDCTAGWSWFQRRCFMFVPNPMSWATAEKHCIFLNSHLASYHSTEEYTFIRDLIHKTSGAHTPSWVGAHDSAEEGTWMWSDGSKFIFTNWATGAPKNNGGLEHCMKINVAEQEHVNDENCANKLPFVCVSPV